MKSKMALCSYITFAFVTSLTFSPNVFANLQCASACESSLIIELYQRPKISDIQITNDELIKTLLGSLRWKLRNGYEVKGNEPIAFGPRFIYERYLEAQAFDSRKPTQPFGALGESLQVSKEQLSSRGEFGEGYYNPAAWANFNRIVFDYSAIHDAGYIATQKPDSSGQEKLVFSKYDTTERRFCADCQFHELLIEHPGRIIDRVTSQRRDLYRETHQWGGHWVHQKAIPMNDRDIVAVIDSAIQSGQISWATFEKSTAPKSFGEYVMSEKPDTIQLDSSQINELKSLREKMLHRASIKEFLQFVGTSPLNFSVEDLLSMPNYSTPAEKVRLQLAKLVLGRNLLPAQQGAIVDYTRAIQIRAQNLVRSAVGIDQSIRQVVAGSLANKQVLLQAGYQPKEISQLILNGVI